MNTESLCPEWQPKNLCSIGSVIGGLFGLGGSIIGASSASDASEKAAEAQVRSSEIAADVSREALDFERAAFGLNRLDTRGAYSVGRADSAPYRATGAAALGALNNMFIPGGQPVVALQAKLNDLRSRREMLAGPMGSGVTGTGDQTAPNMTAPNIQSGSFTPGTVQQVGQQPQMQTAPLVMAQQPAPDPAQQITYQTRAYNSLVPSFGTTLARGTTTGVAGLPTSSLRSFA